MNEKGTFQQPGGKATDVISSFIDKLYSQFIHRDLFAKIAPGFVAVLSTFYFLFGLEEELIHRIANLSFWHWLMLLSICWIAGFILQHGGIRLGYLADYVHSLWNSKKEEDKKLLNEYFSNDIRILIPAPQEFRKVRERTIVIKEACGNGSMALLYMATLLCIRKVLGLLFYNHRLWDDGATLISVCFIIIVLLSARILWRAHHYHSDRALLFREEFINASKSKQQDGINQEDRASCKDPSPPKG